MALKKTHRLIVYIVLTLVVAGAIGWRWFWRDHAMQPVPLRRGDVREAVYGLGRVKTDRRFEVKIGVMSPVRRIFVREGDFVRKGARLIEFDSNALFQAPFDGTVTLVVPREGEVALPQTVQLRLEDLRDRYIELALEQEGALRVRPGQVAKVSLESLRGDVLEGKVTALFSREAEFLAHIRVDHLAESVLPGMTADVSVEVGTIKDALLVPLGAVKSGHVLVRRQGRQQKIKIEVGHVDGQWAEVKSGNLKADDVILVAPVRE